MSEFQKAYEYAATHLKGWVDAKFSRLNKQGAPLLGPTLDAGTYYYRIGHDLDSLGLKRSKFEQRVIELTNAGIPEIDSTELQHVALIFHDQLTETLPTRKFVIKHFPGGNAQLEFTEDENVHYSSQYPISTWIDTFKSAKKSWGVMLSHASYDLDAFPDITSINKPDYPEFLDQMIRKAFATHAPNQKTNAVYSYVPASMNPYIIQYLKEKVGHEGALVSDWYDMGSIMGDWDGKGDVIGELGQENSVVGFIEKLDFSHLHAANSAPKEGDKILLLAVSAGVHFIRPVYENMVNPSFWKSFEQTSPEAYNAFENRLNKVVLDGYNAIKEDYNRERSIEDIAKLPLNDKLELLALLIPRLHFFSPKRPEINAIIEAQTMLHSDSEMYQTFNWDNFLYANDLYSRGGVMVTAFRAKVLEHITGFDFPDVPINIVDEEQWLAALMRDTKFRDAYDKIDWKQVNQQIDWDSVRQQTPLYPNPRKPLHDNLIVSAELDTIALGMDNVLTLETPDTLDTVKLDFSFHHKHTFHFTRDGDTVRLFRKGGYGADNPDDSVLLAVLTDVEQIALSSYHASNESYVDTQSLHPGKPYSVADFLKK